MSFEMSLKMETIRHYSPSLIQIDYKYNVITETGQPMSGWHCDNERKDIIDKRIECFVHKGTPWQRGNRFQFIIDKQLWQHKQKTERIDTVHH